MTSVSIDQVTLDKYVADLDLSDCCAYYESIKGTYDVYMVPYLRRRADQFIYESYKPATKIPSDYEYSFALYKVDKNNWIKDLYNIDLKRIYTKETWDQVIPRHIQVQMNDLNRLTSYYEMELAADEKVNFKHANMYSLIRVSQPEAHIDALSVYKIRFMHMLNSWVDSVILA